MEKKYVITKTNEPIAIGEILACDSKRCTSFGTLTMHEEHELTEENVEDFVKSGILKVVDSDEKEENTKDLNYYIEKLSKDLGMSIEATIEMLEKLTDYCPSAALDLMLSCIEDEVCKNIVDGVYFYINLEDDKWNIESCYTNPCNQTSAFFDTRSQAEEAAKICSGILNKIYE